MGVSVPWLSPALERSLAEIVSPAFVIDLDAIRRNCETLRTVEERSGARVLLALKAFAAWSCFDVISEYLSGTAASGPHEARLGAEHFRKEVHTYAPAFSDADLRESLKYSDHIVFNSVSQWLRFRHLCVAGTSGRARYFGLRINPEHSEVAVPLYDPCRPGSRLGACRSSVEPDQLEGITGLHFHTLCELGSDALERTLAKVEQDWGSVLHRMQWVNFGGGHHVTKAGYDVDRLVKLVRDFSAKYGVQVYLEPGEAIALDAGVLVASVLDLVDNQGECAVLDVSATAHLPDVLEMPYRPEILGPVREGAETAAPQIAGEAGAYDNKYRLGGVTCLAGDEIGEYSFAHSLRIGDRLVFRDMAIYSMVKTTTFNGVSHPDIVLFSRDSGQRLVRRFSYEDYRNRLS